MRGFVETATQESFERDVLQQELPVLVEFWATWNGPSKALRPIVELMATEFRGRARFFRLDIDESPLIAEKYRVRSLPTVMIFKNGQKVGEHVGLMTRGKFVRLLDLS
jgi:thioredoxin 1